MIEAAVRVTKVIRVFTDEHGQWATPEYLTEIVNGGEGAIVESVLIEIVEESPRA